MSLVPSDAKIPEIGASAITDKQIFARIMAGIVAAILGGLLVIPIQFIYSAATHRGVDGGDDGWAVLWIVLMVVSGIAGFVFSANWARKRYPEFRT